MANAFLAGSRRVCAVPKWNERGQTPWAAEAPDLTPKNHSGRNSQTCTLYWAPMGPQKRPWNHDFSELGQKAAIPSNKSLKLVAPDIFFARLGRGVPPISLENKFNQNWLDFEFGNLAWNQAFSARATLEYGGLVRAGGPLEADNFGVFSSNLNP